MLRSFVLFHLATVVVIVVDLLFFAAALDLCLRAIEVFVIGRHCKKYYSKALRGVLFGIPSQSINAVAVSDVVLEQWQEMVRTGQRDTVLSS